MEVPRGSALPAIRLNYLLVIYNRSENWVSCDLSMKGERIRQKDYHNSLFQKMPRGPRQLMPLNFRNEADLGVPRAIASQKKYQKHLISA